MKTKKAISLILALFIVWAALPIQSAFASPKRWYVATTGDESYSGDSWTYARSNLMNVMNEAGTNDEIWVAEGTYSPGDFANDTFLLEKGVKVYGGFLGTETELSARNLTANETILDGGNINLSVVTGGTDATPDDTRLDGFTIKGGNVPFAFLFGGGMYNDSSSPTVANCTFSGNTANWGGGMYNTNNSSPTVENCTFSGNTANYYGGGMYNENNSSPTVANCTFSGNTANSDGGGMYNENNSRPKVKNCTFSGNTANQDDGGGMYNANNSSPTVANCTFSGNTANSNGGGMYNDSSSPTVANCTFSGNTSENLDGGGMYNYNSSPTVTNCAFTANTTERYGGGMSNLDSSPTVVNCTLSGNTSKSGGGMCNYNSSPTVTNCTLSDNRATLSGGGINNLQNASPILANTILWGNTAPADWGPDIFQNTGILNLKNCVVEKYKFYNADENISNLITGDPKLKALNKAGGSPDTASDVYIYKLQTGSSAIDAGLIGNGITVPNKDQRGTDRPQGAGVDIGSYEAEYTITSVEVNPDTASVKKGETQSFTANVTGTGDYNNTVTWSVIDKTSSGTTISDSGTLAVAADENATALTVKATSKGDSTKSDTATVTVEEAVAVTGVTVDPETLTLTAGGAAETLTATVLPTDAANKDVTWASNNETVATVANGVVTPLAAGQAIITVKTVDGNYQATCTVNVNAATVAVTSVSVDPETLTLTAGGATGTLTATVLPTEATNKDVTWASNNEAVATVADGVVTPIGAGQAIITVKTVDGSKTATCTVTVQAAAVPVTGVKLNKTSTTLVVGGSETLYATVEPATATNKNVIWSSDKHSVATVDTIGNVKAVGVGTATITVTTEDGNKTAACTVTVQSAGINYTTVSGDGQTHTRSSGEDLLLTVKRNTEDNKSFGLFRELRKDGAPVSKSHYTTQGGSIIIRLKSAWLDTLSAGLHTLSIIFEDGEAKASFTIKAKPGSFEDVTVPKDSFTFTKLWQGGTEKGIDWTLYDEMDQVAHKLFNKKVVSKTEWKYEAWFDKPVSRYVVEKPVAGYSTRYKNVGVYAGITDRCCNGGTIINYKIPQTGDKADLALWAGLVLLGITGIGIALMAGKRRKTRK